jgi:hypothetical protein
VRYEHLRLCIVRCAFGSGAAIGGIVVLSIYLQLNEREARFKAFVSGRR